MNVAAKPVILLVQEDARVRHLIEGHLAQSYHLVTASEPSEALGRALEARPDLVLSDRDDLVLSIRSVADLDRVPVLRLMPVNDARGEVHALRLELRGNLTQPFPPHTLGHELDAVLRDKLLQDERYELAHQAQRAVEAAELGSFEVDVIRDKISWSPELKRLFGAPLDQEVLDLEWVLKRIHPEDREYLLKVGTAALDPDGPRRFDAELRIVPRPSETRWILVRGRASSESTGERANTVLGTVVDITDLKLAEQHHHERRGCDYLDRLGATNRPVQRGGRAHLRLDARGGGGEASRHPLAGALSCDPSIPRAALCQ